MDRILLSEFGSLNVYSEFGVFADGDTITAKAYKNGSSTPESQTTGTVTQISNTGVFYYDLSDLVNQPTALSEYYWTMTDATTKKDSGLIRVGGWVELLNSLPQALDPANICRITTQLYEADGSCIVDPNTFANQSVNANYIELKTTFHDGSRYFKFGQFAPSYDESTGNAFWLLPREATVDVKLSSFGISETGVTVPDLSTQTLYDWLNP